MEGGSGKSPVSGLHRRAAADIWLLLVFSLRKMDNLRQPDGQLISCLARPAPRGQTGHGMPGGRCPRQ